MTKEKRDKFLKELMEETYDRVYIFIGRKQKDRNFVEDVVQETFLEAYRKADFLMNHPNRMGWLYTTARNKMMKMAIKRKETCSLEREEDHTEEIEFKETVYNEIELAETLRTSVSKREYEMVCDYYLKGYTYEEIADKYGIDVGSIRMRMSRVKKKLRDSIMTDWL